MHLIVFFVALPFLLLLRWITEGYSQQAVDSDVEFALSIAIDRGWVSAQRLASEGQMQRSRAKAVLRAARARKLLRRELTGRHYPIVTGIPVERDDGLR